MAKRAKKDPEIYEVHLEGQALTGRDLKWTISVKAGDFEEAGRKAVAVAEDYWPQYTWRWLTSHRGVMEQAALPGFEDEPPAPKNGWMAVSPKRTATNFPTSDDEVA